MQKWKQFEELVAQIYRELTPGAQVIHNDKIQGVESGILRQIDVSIRSKIAGHEILSIIQAKDTSTPADVNVVGEFVSVVSDVRANKGILICKSGFTENAAKYAQNRGIDICNIHDAVSRDWALEIQLPVLWIDLEPTLRLGVAAKLDEGDSIPKDPSQWDLSNDHGKTRINVIGAFVRAWNDGLIHRDIGPIHRLVDPQLKTLEIAALDKDGQQVLRGVADLSVEYSVSQRAWLGSFSPEECRGVFNYGNDTFTVSHLPMGTIPKERDASWKEIDNPDELAIIAAGILVTTEGWQIDPNTGYSSGGEMRRIGDA